MISVIASIRVKPGTRTKFLRIFKLNAVLVKNEIGCVEYFPAIDIATDISAQSLDENRITIIEKWTDLGSLYSHRSAPHMLDYKTKVKNLVEHVDMKILTEV